MSDPGSAPPPEPLHLRPTAELAERVLLPGDPGRALALAQTLLDAPRMFNHHRGLWGYTGKASDGQPVTIQSTGMGGPSAAIVLSELIALGARRAIRVGTCGALSPELGLGDLVIARESICADGTSAALGARERAAADGALTERLCERAAGARVGTVVSVDLFYDADGRQREAAQREPAQREAAQREAAQREAAQREPAQREAAQREPAQREAAQREAAQREAGAGLAGSLSRWRASGALAVEMEAATIFALGEGADVSVACVLAVSDTFDAHGARSRIDDHSLLKAAEQMGAAAIAALAA